jgi:hypothetical protein
MNTFVTECTGGDGGGKVHLDIQTYGKNSCEET